MNLTNLDCTANLPRPAQIGPLREVSSFPSSWCALVTELATCSFCRVSGAPRMCDQALQAHVRYVTQTR